jgi:hypothetical protein
LIATVPRMSKKMRHLTFVMADGVRTGFAEPVASSLMDFLPRRTA